MKLKLYGYWRSSASWRVRWALELKKIPYEYIPVNILKGEHRLPEHLERNAMGALPVLEYQQGKFLSQSMAILLWIEDNFGINPYIFGKDRTHRYRIIELCELINADTAPLQTPRVQNEHTSDVNEKKRWAAHFTRSGLKAFEEKIKNTAEDFCMGKELSAADLFLIPQLYNARRFEIDTAKDFPLLEKIYQNSIATSECVKSSPEKQSDAQTL